MALLTKWENIVFVEPQVGPVSYLFFVVEIRRGSGSPFDRAIVAQRRVMVEIKASEFSPVRIVSTRRGAWSVHRFRIFHPFAATLVTLVAGYNSVGAATAKSRRLVGHYSSPSTASFMFSTPLPIKLKRLLKIHAVAGCPINTKAISPIESQKTKRTNHRS